MRNEYAIYDPSEQVHSQVELQHMPHYFHSRSEGPFATHTHNDYMLIWFTEDGSWHEVDFVKYPVRKGTLFVISPGQLHRFDEECKAAGAILHFSEDVIAGETTKESVFIKYNVFNAVEAPPYYNIDAALAQRLNDLLPLIERELADHEAFANDEVVSMLLRYFLIEIQRRGVRGNELEPMKITCRSNQAFVAFRQKLEQHFHELHTVKEYAALLGMTQKMLTRSVWNAAHTTPLQIINQRIMLEARRLLAYSDLKIKEISYRLGFDDPSYFVKFFKRMAGLSPIAFREQHSL